MGVDRHSPHACDLPGDGGQPVTGCVGGVRDAGGHHETVVADAEGAASEGGHYAVGPGTTYTALAGGNTATPAGNTGAVKVDGYGNYVTELASGRSSHGRGRIFVEIYFRVSSLIKYDVYDVIKDAFPVRMETTAVELLCSHVVAQTRPQGGCDPVLPPRRYRRRDFLTEDVPEVVDSGRESIIPDPDVCGGICVMPDRIPVVVPKSTVVPLTASVVTQTRPRGGCGSNLLLLVDRRIEPLDGDGPYVLISGRESAMMISDVGRDICVEPDQLPVVVSEEAVGPLAFTAVDLTRSQGGGALVVARPADGERILQVEVDQDLLSGQIMKSVDPDEESGDQTSLYAFPIMDGDACHAEWQETVVEDAEMAKFVLVPEVCPVVSMTSAAEPMFGPVLSEVYSPVVFAGGGGCCGIPLAVVVSDTA